MTGYSGEENSVGTVRPMVVAVAHLTLSAIWLGSMVYSLIVVQPRVASFFADEDRHEEFLLVLAHGNRWPVVAVICALTLSAGYVIVTMPGLAGAYAIALVLYAAAGALFCEVSWRHWPARVFALPQELPRFRRRLRCQAWIMLGLVGAAYIVALSATTRQAGL
jgi:hypothetical protein